MHLLDFLARKFRGCWVCQCCPIPHREQDSCPPRRGYRNRTHSDKERGCVLAALQAGHGYSLWLSHRVPGRLPPELHGWGILVDSLSVFLADLSRCWVAFQRTGAWLATVPFSSRPVCRRVPTAEDRVAGSWGRRVSGVVRRFSQFSRAAVPRPAVLCHSPSTSPNSGDRLDLHVYFLLAAPWWLFSFLPLRKSAAVQGFAQLYFRVQVGQSRGPRVGVPGSGVLAVQRTAPLRGDTCVETPGPRLIVLCVSVGPVGSATLTVSVCSFPARSNSRSCWP